MSESTSDYCKAPGCHLPGGIGSADGWMCRHHAGKDANEWPAITSEVQRLSWLGDAVTAILRYHGAKCWAVVWNAIKQEFTLRQRKDLLQLASETPMQWARRLESEISRACRPDAPMPMEQGMRLV